MDSKILKYFKKNHIQIEDIKYLTRVDGKTCIHTMNNQTFLTYITVKDFFESFFLLSISECRQKWLVAYTDVAVNGNSRYIRDYSPEINKEIFVRCFQPLEGFCACLLTPVDDLNRALPATHLPNR